MIYIEKKVVCQKCMYICRAITRCNPHRSLWNKIMHRISFQNCYWNSGQNSEQNWAEFFPEFLSKLGLEFWLEVFFISGLIFSQGAASQTIAAIRLKVWSKFMLELCPVFRHNLFMIFGSPSNTVYNDKILVGMLLRVLARI